MFAREVQLQNHRFHDNEIKDIIKLLKILLSAGNRRGENCNEEKSFYGYIYWY